ncbi:MAG: hypothetical protein KJ638_07140 [Chloroflexi bacterium]|nr:hypothetical protein [Chloroflexota bacterium]
MSNEILGIDVSTSGQGGPIDWQAAKLSAPANLKFVAIRATISWGYVDKWFANNWVGVKTAGFDRLAYHIVYPDESAERQMDNFLRQFSDDDFGNGLVLDVEKDHGKKPDTIGACVAKCIDIIQSRTGKAPILYSRAFFIKDFSTVHLG